MIDKKIIGEAIVRLRGHRSQRSLARRAGVPSGTWCQWERGRRRPRDTQIPKLLKGLDCTEDDLTVMIWRVTGEKLKLKGSDSEASVHKALADHQRQITALMRKNFRNVPADLRPILIRLQGNVRETGEKLMAINADLEALMIAIGQRS